MLKLRTKNNKRFKVSEDITFIEICDVEGNLGALIHLPTPHEIIIAKPGDTTFERYVRVYGSKLSKFIEHKPNIKNPFE